MATELHSAFPGGRVVGAAAAGWWRNRLPEEGSGVSGGRTCTSCRKHTCLAKGKQISTQPPTTALFSFVPVCVCCPFPPNDSSQQTNNRFSPARANKTDKLSKGLIVFMVSQATNTTNMTEAKKSVPVNRTAMRYDLSASCPLLYYSHLYGRKNRRPGRQRAWAAGLDPGD